MERREKIALTAAEFQHVKPGSDEMSIYFGEPAMIVCAHASRSLRFSRDSVPMSYPGSDIRLLCGVPKVRWNWQGNKDLLFQGGLHLTRRSSKSCRPYLLTTESGSTVLPTGRWGGY